MDKQKKNKDAAILFTGGKDSCLALLKAKQQGYNIKYLLTILPSSYDSYMYHKPSLPLIKMQAKMLNIPLILQKSKSQKEKELKDLEKLLKRVKGKTEFIVTGGVSSKYQSERIEKLTKKLGFKILSPLWNLGAEKVWKECLKNQFEIILTKICCEGLEKEWLGKIIDDNLFKKLIYKSKKHGFSLEFEGGDAETAVLFMPLFKKRMKIISRIKSEGPYRHFLIIKKIKG
jgi:ABC transporter with metal-binding/Fe-S-binding domain ATP-binding protein